MSAPVVCSRCGGPAVVLAQTGETSCARQCHESPIVRAERLDLERLNADIARMLQDTLGPMGLGFVLVLHDFRAGGSMAYASNGQRADCVCMLRELLDKILATEVAS